MKPEGIFNNGDLWYGERELEEGKYIFAAYKPTSNKDDGPDYDTEEIPERFPLFSLIIFPDGTKESETQEYFLQKQIGDKKFGSECRHERAKRGYCPDCLRKVI